MERISLPPRPSSLIESMRDIGYSLETAIADIIDNSITARAKNIHIRFSWNNGDPWLAIIDDGLGMSKQILIESMRFGSTNPLDIRDENDLGRFGLGLKTASFSHCRSLTVLTKSDNIANCAKWDLDSISESTNANWQLNLIDVEQLNNGAPLYQMYDNYLASTNHGTIVFWDKLDRLSGSGDNISNESNFNDIVNNAKEHLELVFHRFISPNTGQQKTNIFFNNNSLIAYDPFNTNSSTELRVEEFTYQGARITVQPYILPHHNKVSKTEWKKYSGKRGYLHNQGFYVYRNRRLIIYGTWFRLLAKEELTKLIRVKVDIPNSLDHLWRIDIKKSNAFPPAGIRDGLKRIINKIEYSGKKVYKQRGQKLSSKDRVPGWQRIAKENQIFYEINKEHPLIETFYENNTNSNSDLLDSILEMLESSFPRDSFFNDVASTPENVTNKELTRSQIENLLEYFLIPPNIKPDKNRLYIILNTEPFASNKQITKSIFNERNYEY